ncbi:MAG: hypothetical protein PHG23_03625 [Candidatus Pacebacteria bacterium]|nr:hypothetical protein [Candidatus Paceibacterota bacterium]
MKFFPTITTIKSAWPEKIKEATDLGLKEVAVFPTCLEAEQRKNLYNLLQKSTITSIPLVHLKSDMEIWELDYFVKKYNTQVFNTHSASEYPFNPEWMKYKNIICVENTFKAALNEEELSSLGGICLDFAHLENDRLVDKEKFMLDTRCLEKFPIKCNHISAIKTTFEVHDGEKIHYDNHKLVDNSELDYLRRYPLNYFSDFCAMEFHNKIAEQIMAIDYIENLLKNRDDFIKGMGF